jgi:hypothetical protein
MSIIKADSIYYHTSYKIIDRIDLSIGKKGNDFGQGFYLTSSERQATRFIGAAIRKSGESLGEGYVLKYRLKNIEGLMLYEFETTDAAWLHCVCAYRSGLEKAFSVWEGYDIVAGKVANDDTNATISFYLNGAYGDVGSEEAVTAALHQLRPDVLEDQICLRTYDAINRLEFMDAKKVIKDEQRQ